MGLERAEADEETVRASMVSSTLGAPERPGRMRGGELGFWDGESGSSSFWSSEYW